MIEDTPSVFVPCSMDLCYLPFVLSPPECQRNTLSAKQEKIIMFHSLIVVLISSDSTNCHEGGEIS